MGQMLRIYITLHYIRSKKLLIVGLCRHSSGSAPWSCGGVFGHPKRFQWGGACSHPGGVGGSGVHSLCGPINVGVVPAPPMMKKSKIKLSQYFFTVFSQYFSYLPWVYLQQFLTNQFFPFIRKFYTASVKSQIFFYVGVLQQNFFDRGFDKIFGDFLVKTNLFYFPYWLSNTSRRVL